MSDWNVESDSLIDTISYGSEFSFVEDCDRENDEPLQKMLINIDKIVFLDKKPPPKFPHCLIKECNLWNKKFKDKYSESERGSIFLRFINCPDHLLDTFSRSSKHSSGKSRVFRNQSSTSSKSSSSTDTFDLILNFKNSSISDYNQKRKSSKSTMLDPISREEILQRKVIVQLQRKPPFQLPPINSQSNQEITKSWGLITSRRDFPSPPVVFSIDKLLPQKSAIISQDKLSSKLR